MSTRPATDLHCDPDPGADPGRATDNDPGVGAGASDARFWNRIARRYSRNPVADQTAYEHKLALTRAYLRPDMNVLEIGCGTGSTALAHAPHVHQVRATDLSPAMIEIARGKATDAGTDNVSFEQASAETLQVRDASVDAVLALSLLHLVADRDATLGRIHRMLKPGGLLVHGTPCLGDFARWFALVGPIGHRLGLLPRLRVFTRVELASSIGAAGFVVEETWQPAKDAPVFCIARKA